MSNFVRLTLTALPLLVLTACGGGADKQGPGTGVRAAQALPAGQIGKLCIFGARRPPVTIVHRDATGAQWHGDVKESDYKLMRTKWFSRSDKRMTTVVAAPRVKVYRVKIDDNCYDKNKKTYHACTKTITADLTPIRVIARALDLGDASNLARQECSRRVRDTIAKKTDVRQEGHDLRCKIIATTKCSLPAPKQKPKPKSAE